MFSSPYCPSISLKRPKLSCCFAELRAENCLQEQRLTRGGWSHVEVRAGSGQVLCPKDMPIHRSSGFLASFLLQKLFAEFLKGLFQKRFLLSWVNGAPCDTGSSGNVLHCIPGPFTEKEKVSLIFFFFYPFYPSSMQLVHKTDVYLKKQEPKISSPSTPYIPFNFLILRQLK